MVSAQRTQSGEFVLSERRLSGTSAEMFQQLDELIESLLGFRKWLVEEGPRTTATNSASPRRRRANGLASVALAAAFTTRWWRWILGALGAALLVLPSVGIGSEELGSVSGWTTMQWVLGIVIIVAIFATIVLLPVATVRATDWILSRVGLREPGRTPTITSDLATSAVA